MSEPRHPTDFSDCVSRDVYERDLKEMMKALETLKEEHCKDRDTMYDVMSSKKEELQKEINYKSKSNRQLIIWASGVSIGISAYLFAQINMIGAQLTAHTQLLWHEGAHELLQINSERIVSLMCKVYGAMC